MRSIFVFSYILLVFGGCDYNRFDPLPESEPSTLTANTTLSRVAQFYRDGDIDLPVNTIVNGTVTTSDSASNFYKLIVIQQGETPLVILTGTYGIYTVYRMGDQVTVRLDRLRLGLNEGMLSVGAPGPEYDTQIEDISFEHMVRQIIVRTDAVTPTPVDTLLLTISEVTADMAGRLVRLTGGAFTQGGQQKWGGERTFAALQGGESIKVYTNLYASFADEILPKGAVDLVGIVAIYKDVVQIKISSTDDIFY